MKKTTSTSRRGSALLIVLGMLTFMLFSGLAFSVYMRQSRMPSSFLRRTAASRQLAKAALALAIDEIDAAIGNNPHPGVGNAGPRRDIYGTSVRYNEWDHRVFLGCATNQTAAAEDTVATLTLEGVAYLPPSIIDEVRYYSRRTQTAEWHDLYWDAGRYAYTAIDVSDYFDVNRVRADLPRSSAAQSRADFSHLFEDGNHESAPDASAAEKWEEMFEQKQARKIDGDGNATLEGCVPFVSMADFNLALGKEGCGKVQSPFCKYVSGDWTTFSSTSAGDWGVQRGMTFVADSWHPPLGGDPSAGRVVEFDLSDARAQPFSRSATEGELSLMTAVAQCGSDMKKSRCGQLLGTFGMFALLDYLDVDSKPLSLAFPTVERNPMICALNVGGVAGALDLTEEKGEIVGPEEGTQREVTQEFTYKIKGNSLMPVCLVRALALYPFRHRDSADTSAGYTMSGAVRMFFTREGEDIPLKTGNDSDVFRAKPESGLRDGVLTGTFQNVVSFPEEAGGSLDQAVDSAICDIQCPVDMASVVDKFDGNYILKVTRKWIQTRGGKEQPWTPIVPPANATVENVDSQIPYILRNGTASGQGDWRSLVEARGKLKLNVAVTARINRGADTVDLVPASFDDDGTYLGGGPSPAAFFNGLYDTGSGSFLLKSSFAPAGNSDEDACVLDLNEVFKDDGQPFTPKPVELARSSFLVVDPRFNHDPESWIAVPNVAADALKEKWKEVARSVWNGRDGDPFMAVSDQGYLQSIYELSHILRISDAPITDTVAEYDYGDTKNGDFRNPNINAVYGDLETWSGANGAAWTRVQDDYRKCRNYRLMWRTYSPFDDDFEGLHVTAGRHGNMVNPYGPRGDIEPLMAAFANTPHAWRYASTNETANPHGMQDDVATFNSKYAWNGYSSSPGGKFAWDDLRQIATSFREKMLQGGGKKWEDAYFDLWDDLDVRLANDARDANTGDTGPVLSTDRDFLYGFWHECFSSRQQLFLIFVRAEPMMMGGGVASIAPPQLGARAVALVWRDPAPTKTDGSGGPIPHSSRILFYHPLE